MLGEARTHRLIGRLETIGLVLGLLEEVGAEAGGCGAALLARVLEEVAHDGGLGIAEEAEEDVAIHAPREGFPMA